MAADETAVFRHDVLFYDSTSDLVASTSPFLREGLELREEVVLACSDATRRAFSESLEADERIRISYLPQGFCSRVPSAIGMMQSLMRERLEAGSGRVRLVAETAVGEEDRNWKEWARVEAACNQALSDFPLWKVCAYDSRASSEEVLADAELTHPQVRRGDVSEANPFYIEPKIFLDLTTRDHVDPVEETEPLLRITGLVDLALARREIRTRLWATDAGPSTIEDFVLAVNEVVSNALRHGSRPVSLRVWATAHRLVATVTDRGGGFRDPFAVYNSPAPHRIMEEGMGLWFVRQLCEELTADHRPEGFTVRLAVRRRATTGPSGDPVSTPAPSHRGSGRWRWNPRS